MKMTPVKFYYQRALMSGYLLVLSAIAYFIVAILFPKNIQL